MKYCAKCNVAIHQEEAIWCGFCGEKLIRGIIKCSKCNAEVGIWNKFCMVCGRPLQEEINAYIRQQLKEGGERDENRTA